MWLIFFSVPAVLLQNWKLKSLSATKQEKKKYAKLSGQGITTSMQLVNHHIWIEDSYRKHTNSIFEIYGLILKQVKNNFTIKMPSILNQTLEDALHKPNS